MPEKVCVGGRAGGGAVIRTAIGIESILLFIGNMRIIKNTERYFIGYRGGRCMDAG